ncbi:hypothetical protein A4H97_32430 [Niastella yeongjuensis]|uniref:LamG-like jellyroll fold domain-containing protein n=1 Tax=Niastella yeongjuensis TaxID=354355 RepID=A0A1V9EHB5_9BACT|nr:LamG domain-containing protein [Niastella yeongjuensis]OQP45452.1 hypothetical protein A4H97_32430 [Niastella yeongjuensis]SEO76304.1 Concanavalin A-like lectin/glucanases superfamily protein [Niastella yeongjuensis]
MKIVAWCLTALVVVVTLTTACKKDPKPSDPVVIHDTLTVKDTVVVNPPPSCTPNLTKGLLAYYPFNGNFNDESGNGNTATAKNGVLLTSDYKGKANSCAGFDGVDDVLVVPGTKLNSDTFTVSFQVLANSTNRFYGMINRVNYETGLGAVFAIHHRFITDTMITFSTPKPTEDCSTISGPDPAHLGYSRGSIKAGKWYNIVCSFAGGVQKIYVNGVLESVATKAWTTAKKCNNADLTIGGWWKGDAASIDGKIDEVRFYNRALSWCEISTLAEGFKQ